MKHLNLKYKNITLQIKKEKSPKRKSFKSRENQVAVERVSSFKSRENQVAVERVSSFNCRTWFFMNSIYLLNFFFIQQAAEDTEGGDVKHRRKEKSVLQAKLTKLAIQNWICW